MSQIIWGYLIGIPITAALLGAADVVQRREGREPVSKNEVVFASLFWPPVMLVALILLVFKSGGGKVSK